MDVTRLAAAVPAQLAKGALRRLAMAKLEPTPANYARAFAEESGEPLPPDGALPARARSQIERLATRATDDAALRVELIGALMEGRFDVLQRTLDRAASASAGAGQAWALQIDRLVRALDRGGRLWTGARKKESLQRVLDSSRSDAHRLRQRLSQLLTAWEGDKPDEEIEAAFGDVELALTTLPGAEVGVAAPGSSTGLANPQAVLAPVTRAASVGSTISPWVMADPAIVPAKPDEHPRVVRELQAVVVAGLPADDARAVALADELAMLALRVVSEGATADLADAVAEACQRARRMLGLRHELVNELLALCASLTDGLTDMAEDGSWAEGQGQSLRQRLDGVNSARAVRAARELLDDARVQQRSVQTERTLARDALKQIVREVLSGLGDLAGATGRFSDKMEGSAALIENADSLESLAELVRDLAGESQAVHEVVVSARARIADEHARASVLESKVLGLESELRRLSDEVSTDALTQVANRRGLAQAFETERAQIERAGDAAGPLAVGLIDIDNFKKLNDSLGHAAGDVALKNLAARVREWLRPVDHVARFGGEEFVVLLPTTAVEEGQQVLTKLQRRLTASLFMHEGREVFITFSAGVSVWRPGETLESALSRADEGLYEAKRTGKNRTCIA